MNALEGRSVISIPEESAPVEIRAQNLFLRREVLYPVERWVEVIFRGELAKSVRATILTTILFAKKEIG